MKTETASDRHFPRTETRFSSSLFGTIVSISGLPSLLPSSEKKSQSTEQWGHEWNRSHLVHLTNMTKVLWQPASFGTMSQRERERCMQQSSHSQSRKWVEVSRKRKTRRGLDYVMFAMKWSDKTNKRRRIQVGHKGHTVTRKTSIFSPNGYFAMQAYGCAALKVLLFC